MQPPFERLLGAEPDTLEPLFDYGYRAAWKVTAGGETYLVKSDTRGDFAEREVRSNRYAHRCGIPTAPLVATAGEPVHSMAFQWVAGAALSDTSTPGAWQAAGRTLRRLHSAPLRGFASERLDYLAQFEAELGWMVDFGAITIGEAQSALAVGRRLESTMSAAPARWIHGDCQPAHIIMSETAEVAAIIDWADAQVGPPAMDFAVLTLVHDDVLGWLLDGYSADAPFREHLRETLPLYQAIRAAGALRWLETHGYPGHAWPAERVRALGQQH